jgi:hypothetical protein
MTVVNQTADQPTERVGPFRSVGTVDRRQSQHAAFVTVIVEGGDGRRYSYDTSCLYFELKPYAPSDVTVNLSTTGES